MKGALLEYLACPSCAGDLEGSFDEVEDGEVMSGALRCTSGERTFPTAGGVPRMNVAMDWLESVARTFGYEWKAHHEGKWKFEEETLFGRTREDDWNSFLGCMGAAPDDVNGAVVLDAGCGSGSFTRLVGEHGAKAAVGVDINEAVDEAFAYCQDLDNVHIVQGNVFALPLKPRAFDLVWSRGSSITLPTRQERIAR